jgi:hypothetical protein
MTPFSSFSSRAALSLSQVSERPNKSLAPHSKDFKDGFIGINDVGRRLGLGVSLILASLLIHFIG